MRPDRFPIRGWDEAFWEMLISGWERSLRLLFSNLFHYGPAFASIFIIGFAANVYLYLFYRDVRGSVTDKGWIAKWNLACDSKLSDTLYELVQQRVAIMDCSGTTQNVKLGNNRTFVGFVGTVTFGLLKSNELPPSAKDALTAVVRFSEFCGTGVETARGMGRTELASR